MSFKQCLCQEFWNKERCVQISGQVSSEASSPQDAAVPPGCFWRCSSGPWLLLWPLSEWCNPQSWPQWTLGRCVCLPPNIPPEPYTRVSNWPRDLPKATSGTSNAMWPNVNFCLPPLGQPASRYSSPVGWAAHTLTAQATRPHVRCRLWLRPSTLPPCCSAVASLLWPVRSLKPHQINPSKSFCATQIVLSLSLGKNSSRSYPNLGQNLLLFTDHQVLRKSGP